MSLELIYRLSTPVQWKMLVDTHEHDIIIIITCTYNIVKPRYTQLLTLHNCKYGLYADFETWKEI